MSYTETLNITYIITEKFCVVSGRESVHPESRGSALCVFRVIILFVFSAFRLSKHIVHTMKQIQKEKIKNHVLHIIRLLMCACVRETGGELPGQHLCETLRFLHNLLVTLHYFKEREEM